MTMKQVRFVKADSRNPVQEIAELAVFDASGKPVDPPTSGGAAIANGSVTTEKLANGAVTSEKLANGAITSEKLKAGNITGYNIANGTVTADKIASGVLPTNATKEKAGLVKQAEHVNPSSGTVMQVVNALIAAGLMASS